MQVVEGLPGVLSVYDDILLHEVGDTYEEALQDHDAISAQARAAERGVKLNRDKVKLRLKEVPFIGHVLTDQGLKSDPKNVKAVHEMPRPIDVAGVQRLIGFVNYLSKFLPKLSETCEPLRQLTQQDVEWHWDDAQQQAFMRSRKLVIEAPV